MRMEKLINTLIVIDDFRDGFNLKHKIIDILVIAILAVMTGAKSWYQVVHFAKTKETWLRQFLELPNGIPSHDTFNRVLSLIEPKKLEECLSSWVRDVFRDTKKGVISIDGKCLRGSRSAVSQDKDKYTHIVSAWAHECGLVIGQCKVDEKTNEITALPELLENLDIEGSVITCDAIGCQKTMTQLIHAKKADYIIALKGNQGGLREIACDISRCLPASTYHSDLDFGHGRIEKRVVRVYSNVQGMIYGTWCNLNAIIRIDSTVFDKRKKTERTEIRYYITSLQRTNAAKIGEYIRQHWEVENKLHWQLDVNFGEDYSRKRAKYAAENFSRLLRFALNLFMRYKKTTGEKSSVPVLQYGCALDTTNATRIINAIL